MEALSTGVPVVVCPGFSDQPMNAQKAVDLGVGLKVDRPFPEHGEEAMAAAVYRANVAAALLQVDMVPAFRATALRYAAGLCGAGGVPRAAELVLESAKTRASRSELWDRFAKVAEAAQAEPAT